MTNKPLPSPNTALNHIVNKDTLLRVVQEMGQKPALEILDWSVEKLGGGSTLAGVYRIAGTASDSTPSIAWSLILKSLPAPAQNDGGLLVPAADPGHSNYWKREFLVYNSALLETLPPEFRAVRCYLAEEKEEACWLWLEDLGDMGTATWSHEDFGLVAYHLGLFNGAWLTGRTGPDPDWLKHSLVRERAFAWDMTEALLSTRVDAFRRSHPGLKQLWGDTAVADTRQLLADRALFLQALDHLPKTLQHQDTSQKNLLLRSGTQEQATTVAIDWGFAGLSALGADLAYLVVSSSRWFGDVAPSDLPDVEALAFEAYLQGLSEAGWQGEAQAIRLGYLLTSSLMFGTTGAYISSASDERSQVRFETVFGHPFEAVILRWHDVHQHVLRQADEARRLL